MRNRALPQHRPIGYALSLSETIGRDGETQIMSVGIEREPRSYWHATFEPVVPDDELPEAADVVVIGGGMLGCWTAYWLARAGVNVALLERRAISWGAT